MSNSVFETPTLLFALLTGISLSACTGFRAFLPPFLVGLLMRFSPDSLQNSPLAGLALLRSDPVLIALGVAVLVEFLGDKVPWIDHLLDTIQAPVKTVIAALMTYSLLPTSGEHSWILAILALILGGGTTITVHSAKAGLRVGSTAATGGILNPVISLLEEGLVVVGTLFAIFLPLLAGLGIVWVFWRCFRYFTGSSGGNDGKLARVEGSYPFVLAVKVLVRLGMGLYNRLRFEGVEHIPLTGPLMIVANHCSEVDGFLIGTAVPRPTHIMVKREAFENPFRSWFLRKTLAFPVDRERPDPTAVKTALKTLQNGGALGIFPEGTRNFQGKIRPFKPGAIRFAVKLKAPIVPAFIANTHRWMPDGCRFPRPVPITLKFGEKLDVAAMLAAGHTEDDIQHELYKRVCALGRDLTGEDVRDFSGETGESSEPVSEGMIVSNPRANGNPDIA